LAREYRYRAPWWLRNPHAQTIWGRVLKRVPKIASRAETLVTPDGDSLELHHLDGRPGAPRVLLLHGLEGSRDSHYVGGMLAQAALPIRVAARFYHSGETSDLDFVFAELTRRDARETCVAGVSLGGNVLLKWLGERGALPTVRAAAAVSVPYDLEAGARKISSGFSRVYDRNFVRSLRRKALAKLAQQPSLFDGNRARRARTIYEFDESVTAPVHGFASARDYYTKSSAIGYLDRIRVRTLLLSSRDDPFLPVEVLDEVDRRARQNPALRVEFHDTGGHVGFVAGSPLRPFYYAEWRVFQFFDDAMEPAAHNGYD